MITWGISANSHDAALAVFSDDGVEFASHAERFSGVKNDAHLNKDIVDYARQWGEPDEVVWYERPFIKTLRQIRAGQGFRFRENNVRNYLAGYEVTAPIRYVDHHLSHAAGGFYTSGFREAVVLCVDSIGEFDTLSIWRASESQGLEKQFKQTYPHSVGLWYSAMTQRIGLKPNEDEYILMGMAAYGDPNRLYHQIAKDFVKRWPDMDSPTVKFTRNLHRGCVDWRPELNSEQDLFDIAAATQKIYEDIFEYLIQYTTQFDIPNLVIAGGCALNCAANHRAYKYYNNVWIMPNPGDAGSSIGAVLAHRKQYLDFDHAYLGYNIEREFAVDEVVKELKTTGICGVANGRAEFGPRALGNRSLLADPRGADVKSRVNRIKQRQQFRPFAPAILAEHAAEYFEGPVGPYMQFTARCKHSWRFPAITHADGTSRVQTVAASDQSNLRKLLEAWYRVTGCPMLLNTSLNIKGCPIANTWEDAKQFEKQYGVRVF